MLSLVLMKNYSIHSMCTYSVPRPQLFSIQKSSYRFPHTPAPQPSSGLLLRRTELDSKNLTILFSLFVLPWLLRRKNLDN